MYNFLNGKKGNVKYYQRLMIVILLAGMWLIGFSSDVPAVDTEDTRMLTRPAISKTHIAFVYAGYLWSADREGKNVRRLATVAPESMGMFIPNSSRPAFSPDGSLIAFSGRQNGNTDVYVIPTEGGIPRRLTWHPEDDYVQEFTPDGSSVLFTSERSSFIGKHHYGPYTRLFTVSIAKGAPQALPIPVAFKAAYSPDGKALAYNPLPEVFHEWKHYRGGWVSEVWLIRFADRFVVKIPQPKGRCNDVGPMWLEDKIYFRSDRKGEFNLFSFDPGSKEVSQLTAHSDFPVVNASAGEGKIIYEQAGYLHVYDPKKTKSVKLTINLAADLPETRKRYIKAFHYIRNADISPTGARAVFEMRGEIITVPAEKGDPRNLTNTPGANERSPVWSPDGKYIAYFSDKSGEYELFVRSQDGKGTARKYKPIGSGFYDQPVWSPDTRKISYTDNSRSLYWMDLETGASKKIAAEPLCRSSEQRKIKSAWSPDSKWIVYTRNTEANIQQLYVYSVRQGKSYPVTDGMSESRNPVFDENGNCLYFLSSTDAGPVRQWFAQSHSAMRMTSSIYVAVLSRKAPSPLAKESDEEINSKRGKAPSSSSRTAIDFDGLNKRILPLPLPSGNYRDLQAGTAGEIYYLKDSSIGSGDDTSPASLCRFDFKSRKEEVILTGINSYILSKDKNKILYRSKDIWEIVPASTNVKAGQAKIDTGQIEIRIDPIAEWRQIFNEAWRINRDYFYDPNMHGVDWKAMREKYADFLPDLTTRDDLSRVLMWMCSELAVGHHYMITPPPVNQDKAVPCGLLGADYDMENGRYRFKKVYGGLNWNPDLRSPLTEPGLDVREGEYLLAVGGTELTSATNIYSLFENTAGKIVEITVGPGPDNKGSRIVSVVPIADETALRYRDWVEGNKRRVDEATGGRVAYVYVPDTATKGYEYFKRYFFPQAQKEAIIIDERFNRGGCYPDYYIDILLRQFVCKFASRYGKDTNVPMASIQGPKVLIINEMSGSGGDLLPWTFRKFGMGKLIGKRTWGGLVGTLGYPLLMDGYVITAPDFAAWDEDGWIAENVGIPPDIEVEQWPAEVMADRDPQLEKAIEVVMKELRENPPKKMKRPPYPLRNK